MNHHSLTPRFVLLFIASCFLGSLSAQEPYDKNVTAKDMNKALLALEGFALSESWEEAAKYVQDADKLKDRMAAHYAKYPWEKIEIIAVPNESANTFNGTVMYKVIFFDLVIKDMDKVIPVAFTEMGDEFKLDWETFVQRYHSTFEDFLKEKSTDPAVFLVAMQRGVPMADEENYNLAGGVMKLRVKYRNFDVDVDGLRVNFVENVFLGKESPLVEQVKKIVPWTDYDGPFRITVKWNKSGDTPFIELVDLFKVDLNTPSMFAGENS